MTPEHMAEIRERCPACGATMILDYERTTDHKPPRLVLEVECVPCGRMEWTWVELDRVEVVI